MDQATIVLFEGNLIGKFFISDIRGPLNAVGYDWYGLMYKHFSQKYGDKAVEAYLSAIQRFAEFDETILYEMKHTKSWKSNIHKLSAITTTALCVSERKLAASTLMRLAGFNVSKKSQ